MRRPVQILKPGQRKSIQNQRVTLTLGEQNEIAVINRIFHEFVKLNREPCQIAQFLNSDGIPSPGNRKWTAGTINSILSNELYIGTMIYNKTGQRLQSPTKKNPNEEWIRKTNAFEAIVNREIFLNAQEIVAQRKAERQRMYSNEDMLQKLRILYDRYGIISHKQINSFENMLSSSTYVKHFTSLDMAFQQMFSDVLDRTKKMLCRNYKPLRSKWSLLRIIL